MGDKKEATKKTAAVSFFISATPSVRFCYAMWELMWTIWGIVSGKSRGETIRWVGGVADDRGVNSWPSAGSLKTRLPHIRVSPTELNLGLGMNTVSKEINDFGGSKITHLCMCVSKLCKLIGWRRTETKRHKEPFCSVYVLVSIQQKRQLWVHSCNSSMDATTVWITVTVYVLCIFV